MPRLGGSGHSPRQSGTANGTIEAMVKPREAWFRRTFLWGSKCIHWKGFVAILISLGVGFGGVFVAMALGHTGLGGFIIFAGMVGMFVVAELHMERP